MPHAAHRLPHAAHRAEAPPRPSVSQWRTATSAAEAVERGRGAATYTGSTLGDRERRIPPSWAIKAMSRRRRLRPSSNQRIPFFSCPAESRNRRRNKLEKRLLRPLWLRCLPAQPAAQTTGRQGDSEARRVDSSEYKQSLSGSEALSALQSAKCRVAHVRVASAAKHWLRFIYEMLSR